MKTATERRLAAAEQRLMSKRISPGVIVINGGLPGSPRYANGGGQIWERATDEAFEAFEQRVITDAKSARLRSVIIGGLPPYGLDLGSLREFLSGFDFPDVPSEEQHQ